MVGDQISYKGDLLHERVTISAINAVTFGFNLGISHYQYETDHCVLTTLGFLYRAPIIRSTL